MVVLINEQKKCHCKVVSFLAVSPGKKALKIPLFLYLMMNGKYSTD